MNRKTSFGRSAFALVAFFVSSVLLSACCRDNDDVEPAPVARLLSFNLVPDQPSVDVRISGNSIPGSPFPFGAYSGRYLDIFTGNRVINSYGSMRDRSLDSTTYNFEPRKYYSLFVLGANNNYKNVITVDPFDTLSPVANRAYIRYVNGVVSTSPSGISIMSGGTNVLTANASLGDVSRFVPVAAGALDITINAGSANATRNIMVEQHKVYSILFLGQPNPSDTSRRVQIRFVENATLTN